MLPLDNGRAVERIAPVARWRVTLDIIGRSKYVEDSRELTIDSALGDVLAHAHAAGVDANAIREVRIVVIERTEVEGVPA